MKKNNLSLLVLAVFFLVPQLASAQLYTLRAMLVAIGSFGNLIIRIIFALSFIYFFWGTSQFILHAGDSKTREEGKKRMLWGVIALFVMISIYGIINWISFTLGVQTGGILELGQGGTLPANVSTGFIVTLPDGSCIDGDTGSPIACP